MDKHGKLYRAYDGTTYLPGIVGLNNIKANDYANAVLQVLMCDSLDFDAGIISSNIKSLYLSF